MRRHRDCNNPAPEFGGDMCYGERIEQNLCTTTNCSGMLCFIGFFIYVYFSNMVRNNYLETIRDFLYVSPSREATE